MTLSLERRASAIAALIGMGYGDRLLLSYDNAVYGGFAGSWDDFKSARQKGAPIDFTFIQKTALPALLAAGVTQAEFDSMMMDNPRRFFEG